MSNKLKKARCFIALAITCFMLLGMVIPVVQATDLKYVKSTDKGPSYTDVVPLKKVTFVNFDKETLLDDYAYMASVPTAVFEHEGRLLSFPLLFFEEEYEWEDNNERVFNSYQGIDYFMEDWMSFCDDKLDQITLINVEESKINPDWKSKETISIDGDNPFSIAADIALQDWSFSDKAVIAVIEEDYKNPEIRTDGEVKGSLSPYEIGKEKYKVDLPEIGASGGTPTFFEVNDENYKYLTAELFWSPKTLDYDLQLTDMELGMLDISMGDFTKHNKVGAYEVTGAFIHNHGKWKASVTAYPKKTADYTISDEVDEESEEADLTETFKAMASAITGKGDLEITMYPGTIVNLEPTPFGCRDIDFKLNWDNPNVRLGFTVLDPAGAEVISSLKKEEIISGDVEKGTDEVEIHLSLMGETREGETYSVCVFSLDDVVGETDFTLSYSWQQNFTRDEGDGLTSASNGAVLASKLNAPLLYVSPSEISEDTKNALYKLGVNEIDLVNIGGHLSSDVKEEIKDIADIKNEYVEFKEIYDAIKLNVDENTIVLTTIDPFTYWHSLECKPAGEYPGAKHVGTASYLAAHHSSPVVIVENHPVLSQAVVYHTDFWGNPIYNQHLNEANSGNMMISSKQVYEFLEEYELGKLERQSVEQQIRERIIIVAGQYDIGLSFDRSLTGAAINGRFLFSPVDAAYGIARNIFYPSLVFENPALKEDLEYINGSRSEVQGLGSAWVNRDKNFIEALLELGARFKDPKGVNLVITKQSNPEKMENPVLMTFNTYEFRTNQRASDRWGTYYTRVDGIIPGITDSPDPIDAGAVPGNPGQVYPDISESEVIPFYAVKAGYDPVFSTSFNPVVENLNQGVLMWVEQCHGWHPDGGVISLWDPSAPSCREENPWRAYEPILLTPGSIRDTIHLLANFLGINLPYVVDFHFASLVGSTENPDVATMNTQLTTINYVLGKIGFPLDLWGAFGRMVYKDRIKHPLQTIEEGLPFINWFDGDGKVTIAPASGGIVTMAEYNGTTWDDALENLHCCGLNSISCLPAGTYMHLAWQRHGMSWVIIDPWVTTDWAGTWNQMLVKYFALGETVGEAYERGMRAIGPEYSVGQGWWDIWENVCYYGDPDLRPYVPSTEYSDENHWEKDDTRPLRYDAEIELDGHMPFGAADHPNAREPQTFIQENLFILSILVIIVILFIALAVIGRKKKR